MKKAADQDQNNDHSDDDEYFKMAAQRCRENRKRLMRRKALQAEFPEEKQRKLMAIGEDEEKERIVRDNIRRIVAFERHKLDMEKKRRREQSGVRDRDEEEEAPRKSENSSRFQESEPEMATEMKNRIKKRATER